MVRMNSVFFLFAITILFVISYDAAHAEPLQKVNADVLEFDGIFATIEVSWNDNGASYYEIGCVSCMPNLSDMTTENTMILSNVTAFANGNALLYVIAYDDADEIISAKQVVVELS